jgi:NTE family protein
VTTDVLSGQRVVFDTARGTRIGPEHIAASGALLPLFAPVEVDGRLLADGGLASNTPLDVVLDGACERPLHCLVADLFPRSGPRPQRVGQSMVRATDVAFANQTLRLLERHAREYQTLALLNQLADLLPPAVRDDAEIAGALDKVRGRQRDTTVVSLVYRLGRDEAEPGKLFDFSRTTLAERWRAGARGMREAVRLLGKPDLATMLAPGLLLHELEAGPGPRLS